MWSDMPALLDRLGVLYPDADGDRARLVSALGINHFVHLARDDRVAQAVSLVIASQTGLWHRNADGTIRQGGESAKAARYDHGLIADALRMLETEQQGWARWFSEQSIAPLDLSYEALSTDPAETTRIVLDHIAMRSVDVPSIGTAKLATPLNSVWAKRFNAEQCSSRT